MRTSVWHEQALGLVRAATLAPSSHNTQPWRFRFAEPAIHLYADRTRALPVNDPDGRERVISCGCALLTLRAAAASRGLYAAVELLPEPREPDWLARVEIGHARGRPAPEGDLAPFAEQRRTYRGHFAPGGVDPAIRSRLVEAAETEGAWLRPLGVASARRAAELVMEGDSAQWSDPRWRRELAAWMRSPRGGDGLAVPAPATSLVRWVVRSFDLGARVGAKNRALAEGAPLLAILGTDDDTAAGWLRAGQALQRMLLVACRDGLQASFLNQPMQVAALRPRMGELAGGGFPQVLVRLGLPCHALRATPRRALDEVLERPWPRAARPAAARGQSAARTAPGTMNALSS